MMNLKKIFSVLILTSLAAGIICAEDKKASDSKAEDFHIGAFMVGPPHIKNLDTEFKRVKELGFNYVHWYCISYHNEKSTKRYMDLAHKNGLKVLMDISKPIRNYRESRTQTFEEAMADFKKQANRLKDHPALGMWYIYDEPHEKNISPKDLSKFNAYLKQLTPNIKTSLALAWDVNWHTYVDCADIMMPDFYPVKEKRYPENIMKLQDEFYSKVRFYAKRPIMPFTQCFGFPNIPNKTEMRYICFSPLINGIKGLYFWSYYYADKAPFKKGKLDKKFLPETVAPIIKDIKAFVKLTSPVEKVTYLPRLKNPIYSTRQLLVGVWERDNKAYIIAINNWAMERNVMIPFNGVISEGKLVPILSTRETDTEIKNSSAALTMKPWETFIWQIDIKDKKNPDK